MNKLRKLGQTIAEIDMIGQLAVIILGMVYLFIIMLKVLQPLSPVITFFVALGFTLHAFRRTWLGIVSLCGIAIYVLSWPVTGKYGLFIGLSVWCAGFFTWLWAVYRSFIVSPRTA